MPEYQTLSSRPTTAGASMMNKIRLSHKNVKEFFQQDAPSIDELWQMPNLYKENGILNTDVFNNVATDIAFTVAKGTPSLGVPVNVECICHDNEYMIGRLNIHGSKALRLIRCIDTTKSSPSTRTSHPKTHSYAIINPNFLWADHKTQESEPLTKEQNKRVFAHIAGILDDHYSDLMRKNQPSTRIHLNHAFVVSEKMAFDALDSEEHAQLRNALSVFFDHTTWKNDDKGKQLAEVLVKEISKCTKGTQTLIMDAIISQCHQKSQFRDHMLMALFFNIHAKYGSKDNDVYVNEDAPSIALSANDYEVLETAVEMRLIHKSGLNKYKKYMYGADGQDVHSELLKALRRRGNHPSKDCKLNIVSLRELPKTLNNNYSKLKSTIDTHVELASYKEELVRLRNITRAEKIKALDTHFDSHLKTVGD